MDKISDSCESHLDSLISGVAPAHSCREYIFSFNAECFHQGGNSCRNETMASFLFLFSWSEIKNQPGVNVTTDIIWIAQFVEGKNK